MVLCVAISHRTDLPSFQLPLTYRRVIRLRRYLEPQRAARVKLTTTDAPFFPEADRLASREQANRTIIVAEELDAQRDRLTILKDDHDLRVPPSGQTMVTSCQSLRLCFCRWGFSQVCSV